MDTMSVRQAFEVMTWFVKQFQDRGPFEDTGSLLHALNRVSAANADGEGMHLWREWCRCVQKTLQFSGQPNEFPLFELGQASWDEQEVCSDLFLTILQAYEATQLFLYRQYLKTKIDDGGIFYLMSNMDLGTQMNLGLWPDLVPADPVYWSDWMASVQKVLLPKTPENQRLVQDLLTHQEHFLGKGPWGEEWYARPLPDGRQLWAEVYGGKLQCAGIRRIPVEFDSRTGLSTPRHP
jgi:hypothetical protein